MIESQRRHVLVGTGWKDSVLASRESVAGRQCDDARGVDVIVFVGRKEVCPVRYQRTCKGSADALLVERWVSLCEGVPRVECVVAAEIEHAPLELIAARPRDHRYDCIERIAILRVELVSEDSELLHAFLRDIDRWTAPLRVIDLAAVDHRCKAAALIGGTTELGDREPAGCGVERSRTR